MRKVRLPYEEGAACHMRKVGSGRWERRREEKRKERRAEERRRERHAVVVRVVLAELGGRLQPTQPSQG